MPQSSTPPGQLADLVALTDDYFSVAEEEIKGIESVFTVVGGKIVHATQEFASHAPPPIPVLPAWSPVKVFGGYGAPLNVRQAAPAGVPAGPTMPPSVTNTAAPMPRLNFSPDSSAWVATASPSDGEKPTMLMKLLEKSLAVEPSGWVAARGRLFLHASTRLSIGVVEDKGGD